jgi:hypothetical protein
MPLPVVNYEQIQAPFHIILHSTTIVNYEQIQALFHIILHSTMSQVRPIGSSPIGRVYIPSSPPPQAAEEGILPFSSSLDVEFRLMLEIHATVVFSTRLKRQLTVAGLRTLMV